MEDTLFKEMHAMAGTDPSTGAPPVANEPTIPVQTQPTIETPTVETPVAETAPVSTESTPAVEPTAPVETPPVVAETPAQPVITPTVAPEVDYAKFLDEKSGGKVKSVEDLNRIISDYESAQERLSDPHVEYAQKLSAWEDEGRPAELFHVIQNLDTEELSVDDVIKLNLKLENPEWTREQIELYVEGTYNQDAEKHDEKSVAFGKLRMESDATKAFKELNALKQKTIVKNDRAAQEASARQAEDNRKATWKQNLSGMVNSLTKVDVPIDAKGTLYTFNVTPEQRVELQNIMETIVMQAPVNYDEKGIAAAKDVMRKEFINRNFNQIAQGINTFTASKKTDEKIVELHNPTGAQKPAQPATVQKKSMEEEAFEHVMKVEGITRGR